MKSKMLWEAWFVQHLELPTNFMKLFGLNLNPLCYYSIKKSFLSGELSISQKQAVINLTERKDRDKRLIKNWKPISLLNIKVLAKRNKKHLCD